MFYFYTNELKFTPEFMGRVRLVGSIASLVGVGCYNFCLKVSTGPTSHIRYLMISAGSASGQRMLCGDP